MQSKENKRLSRKVVLSSPGLMRMPMGSVRLCVLVKSTTKQGAAI